MNEKNILDFDKSKSDHAHTRKEKKLKTMKKAFANYLGPTTEKKKNRKKNKKKPKKK